MPYPSNRRSHALTVHKLIGKTCAKLFVAGKLGKDARHNQVWDCVCECGSRTTATTSQLNANLIGRTKGSKKSCGCLDQPGNPARSFPRPSTALGQGVAARNKLIGTYKRQARNRRLPWSLTEKEAIMLFQGDCHYCGAPPTQEFKVDEARKRCYTGNYIYNGIDRQENSLGYIRDNCVSCCGKCNVMKGTQSHGEFVFRCNRIAKRHPRTERGTT